jgi:hypothetical protein
MRRARLHPRGEIPALPSRRRQTRGAILNARDSGSAAMIRKLKTGEYRIYSRHLDAKTGKRRNLGTFPTREAAQEHEKAIQYFKRH